MATIIISSVLAIAAGLIMIVTGGRFLQLLSLLQAMAEAGQADRETMSSLVSTIASDRETLSSVVAMMAEDVESRRRHTLVVQEQNALLAMPSNIAIVRSEEK